MPVVSTQTGSLPRATTSGAAAATLKVHGFTGATPPGWRVQQRGILGTQLQREATECAAADIIDGPAGGDPGAPDQARALVQFCVVPRDDATGLSEWLVARGALGSRTERHGNCTLAVVEGAAERWLAYAQSDTDRVEVATSVTTTPHLTQLRRTEVATFLRTLRCPSS